MAGFHFGVPVAGTLAHSMIMSYEEEEDVAESRKLTLADGTEIDILDKALAYREKLGWNSTQLKELFAFVAFATAYPTTFSSLVDSYNTRESGLKNFMLVSLVLADHGLKPLSIRLDSGDLASLSQFAKALFKETGDKFGYDFSGIKIVASNDINEKAIKKLISEKHQIDVFGIGTNLVTC
jgi:nicotinate phosphoribosyltransferase